MKKIFLFLFLFLVSTYVLSQSKNNSFTLNSGVFIPVMECLTIMSVGIWEQNSNISLNLGLSFAELI